jgi:hypothetical protein
LADKGAFFAKIETGIERLLGSEKRRLKMMEIRQGKRGKINWNRKI